MSDDDAPEVEGPLQEERLPIDLPAEGAGQLPGALFAEAQRRLAPPEAPYPDSELVAIPIPPMGYPVTMFAAMIEGITRRYPEAKWVCLHGFAGKPGYGDGPMVLHLGPEQYIDDDWDDDPPGRSYETVVPKGDVL